MEDFEATVRQDPPSPVPQVDPEDDDEPGWRSVPRSQVEQWLEEATSSRRPLDRREAAKALGELDGPSSLFLVEIATRELRGEVQRLREALTRLHDLYMESCASYVEETFAKDKHRLIVAKDLRKKLSRWVERSRESPEVYGSQATRDLSELDRYTIVNSSRSNGGFGFNTVAALELIGIRGDVLELEILLEGALREVRRLPEGEVLLADIESAEDPLELELEFARRNRLGLIARSEPKGRDRETLDSNANLLVDRSGVEADLLLEVFRVRVSLGAKPLTLDPELDALARGHALDMVEHGFTGHDSPVEGRESLSDRAKQAGTSAHGECVLRLPPADDDEARAKSRSTEEHLAFERAVAEQVFGSWWKVQEDAETLIGNWRRVGVAEKDGVWCLVFRR